MESTSGRLGRVIRDHKSAQNAAVQETQTLEDWSGPAVRSQRKIPGGHRRVVWEHREEWKKIASQPGIPNRVYLETAEVHRLRTTYGNVTFVLLRSNLNDWRNMRNRLLLAACSSVLFFCGQAIAAEESANVDFARQVLPILSNKCFVCHGPDAAESGEDMRRLDSFEAATADLGSGRAIDPRNPQQSLVLDRIHSADDPMPPSDFDKKLTAEEKQILTRWIQQGGKYALHWGFVRPVKAAVPASGPDNPIDAFVRRRLAASSVDFSPEADRRVIARRVALILTGLPPEPQQLEDFLADHSEGAYARLVEQLLASPRYGEHQARYWLDAVRYGDTHGLHLDNRRGIYPYRDWVVRAFNNNLPFDDFITWQLAGDLLPEPSLEQTIATGFVRLNPSTAEGGAIPAEFQATNNFDRTETLGTVMLGMSMTCARCHTHKYDPITQTEYYQLLAFFNNTAESSMDGNKYEYGPVARVPADQPAWQQWQQLNAARRELLANAKELLKSNSKTTRKFQSDWDKADAAQQLSLAAADGGAFAGRQIQNKAKLLAEKIADAEAKFTTTLVAADLAKPRKTRVLHRGEYDQPLGEVLEPNVLSVMGAMPTDAPKNRLGLAQWLTSKQHPLVARVLVNRIWQRVFGYGLVRTPEDFGVQGEHPTHPELLDWLAVEFQDSGWDLHHLLRLMVHSRTFRQSSAWRTDMEDPENRLYARASSYRLDAEVIRDIGLWSSGLLDPHMGGEGVKPYQPAGMWLAMAHPGSNTKNYKPDTGSRLYRRSLYVYWKRTSPHPMMTLFDAPDREASCVRRSRTNTSLQSLGLLNETQRIEMSRKLAERLIKNHSTDSARLTSLYNALSCRAPSGREQAACKKLLVGLRSRYDAANADAIRLLATGETQIDAALGPVEVAAWSQLVTTVLASDAAILLY